MAARKRKPGESFEKYRKNLKKEQLTLDRRLGGKMGFSSVEFFMKFLKALGKKVQHKRTRTFKDRNERRRFEKENRARRQQINKDKALLRRVQARG